MLDDGHLQDFDEQYAGKMAEYEKTKIRGPLRGPLYCTSILVSTIFVRMQDRLTGIHTYIPLLRTGNQYTSECIKGSRTVQVWYTYSSRSTCTCSVLVR